MTEKTTNERIEEVLESLIGPKGSNALAPTLLGDFWPRLDTSKPNQHDSKREFQMEKDAVTSVISHLQSSLSHFVNPDDDPEKAEMRDRLETAIDQIALVTAKQKSIETPRELALKNVAQTGFFLTSIFVIIDMINVYQKKLKDLEDQEEQYWTVAHRPPNYYARTIAVRLARLYAQRYNAKPTFGIAREGNHPSTNFGRALEEIFQILEIKASVRGAAEWAIGQLTEQEINPPQNALESYAGNFGSIQARKPPSAETFGYLDAIRKAGET